MESQNKLKSILFYDLCRLCLENTGAEDIFTKAELVRDIFLCTGVISYNFHFLGLLFRLFILFIKKGHPFHKKRWPVHRCGHRCKRFWFKNGKRLRWAMVDSEDNLPRKVCYQCLEIVVKAKRLRVLASANEIHLKSLVDDNESFSIGFNKTDQSQKEGISFSRKSSTDSDRTVKLEIVENIISSEDETRKTSDSSEQIKPEEKKITIRKDLFDSSVAVTSSTKDVSTSSTKKNLKVKIKRIKTENGDCFHYVCDVCEKKFNAWKKYYLHQKTHNRNIICTLGNCGKKFATKGDLEKHVRTHTGERPYSCDLCDKRFSQRGSLKSHKLSVHGENGTPEKS